MRGSPWVQGVDPAYVSGLVSIIIPYRNQPMYLADALGSACLQTYSRCEIIVVDNNSDEGSRLSAIRSVDDMNDPRVRHVTADWGSGPSFARNVGAACAKGEFIVPLDADDQIEPSFVARMAELLTGGDCRLAGVAARRHDLGASGYRMAWRRWSLVRHLATNQLPYCGMFRRSLWLEVCGYDEGLLGYEDWEFWLALADRGQLHLVDEPLFRYRPSVSGQYAWALQHDLALRTAIVLRHSPKYGADATQVALEIALGGLLPANWRKSHEIFARAAVQPTEVAVDI